jgi:hypothetical protein
MLCQLRGERGHEIGGEPREPGLQDQPDGAAAEQRPGSGREIAKRRSRITLF